MYMLYPESFPCTCSTLYYDSATLVVFSCQVDSVFVSDSFPNSSQKYTTAETTILYMQLFTTGLLWLKCTFQPVYEAFM